MEFDATPPSGCVFQRNTSVRVGTLVSLNIKVKGAGAFLQIANRRRPDRDSNQWKVYDCSKGFTGTFNWLPTATLTRERARYNSPQLERACSNYPQPPEAALELMVRQQCVSMCYHCQPHMTEAYQTLNGGDTVKNHLWTILFFPYKSVFNQKTKNQNQNKNS